VGDLIAAELAKTVAGRLWWVLIACAVGLGFAADYAFVSQGSMQQASASLMTDNVIRGWSTVHLWVEVFAALMVTREYSVGAILRSVLLSGGRTRLLVAKLVAATVMGTLFAVVGVIAAAVSPWLAMPRAHLSPQWTSSTWSALAGVALIVVAGAVWGSLVGWIARGPVLAVSYVLVSSAALEPYLFDLAPALGRFLRTSAMSSIYQYPEAGLLPRPAAAVVLAAWLVLAGVLAHRLFARRDMP
jgi:ABC-2 family transporter protein